MSIDTTELAEAVLRDGQGRPITTDEDWVGRIDQLERFYTMWAAAPDTDPSGSNVGAVPRMVISERLPADGDIARGEG